MKEYKYLPESKGQAGSESALQKAIAQYLDLRKAIWFHPPNGGLRNKIVASKLKLEGVKAGVPDVVILSKALAIEVKTGRNKPTPSQIEWLEHFRAIGWRAFWVNSLDEFIKCYENS